MEIKTTKLSIFDGLELKEATFRKQCFPSHFHDSYSVGIIEHGIERLAYDNKEIRVHAHTVIIINPYEIHANSYFDNDAWKYRTIYISIPVMKYMQQQMGPAKQDTLWFPRQGIDDVKLYKLLLHFHNADVSKKMTLFQEALAYLISTYARQKPGAEDAQPSSAILDAACYIQQHYNSRIAIDEIADRFGMDKFKFIRLF